MSRLRLALYAAGTVLVLLAAIELLLAVAGVTPLTSRGDPYLGFSTQNTLFVEEKRGNEVWMTTADAKRPFFNQQSFPRRKPAATYRIFCLGGSTTYGHPWTNEMSFCGWLQRFLSATDPSRSWEVINAGGISYASYRVAALMKELVSYEPDLFIAYTGQNEFVEARSYGHLRDLPNWLIEANTLLAHSRLFTALRNLVVRTDDQPKLGPEVEERLAKTVGPEDYHRNDAERTAIISHYRFNLTRMIDMARGSGASLTLIMPGSNLKDMGPFKSESSLPDQTARDWQSRFAAALGTLEPRTRLEQLDRLASEDPRYAALHYERGRTLLTLNRPDEAKTAFLRALEEDIAPLRMLPEMATLLRTVASQHDVPLVDFAAMMEEASRQSTGLAIPGKEWFVDHVHPSIEGYRQLGLALLKQLQQQGVVHGSLDEARIASITTHALGALDAEANGRALMNLGIVLGWAGRIDEAHRLLLEARALLGNHLPLLLRLGLSAERLKRTTEAGDIYRQAASAFPEAPEPWRRLADLAHQTGDRMAEKQHRLSVVQRSPDNAQDAASLAELLAAEGDWLAAAEQYRVLTRLSPTSSTAHVNLGIALANQGDGSSAQTAFSTALSIDPKETDAYLGLAALAEAAQDAGRARDLYTKALQHSPQEPQVHLGFGAFLANTGDLDAAIPHFKSAVQLAPESVEARQNLAMALSQSGRANEARPHFEAARRLRGETP